MNKVFFILILLSGISLAQTDWLEWKAAEINYVKQPKHDSENDNSILGITKSIYQITISDHDGDNCPFHPTCSEFFVEASKSTNIFKGLLMFADRFTRDANLYKIKYTIHKSGKFYDPVENYKLKFSSIKLNSLKLN